MKKKGTVLAFFLCLFWISAHAESTEEVLGRLEEKISGLQTLRAEFIQEKNLAVLDQPLVLKGTIFMEKPGLFAWHVREPLRYSMVIKGEVIRQWDEDTDHVQKVSLSKNPAFKVAIRQMRDWFSGAYKSMLGEYRVTVLGEDPISLKFIPRETAFSHELIDSVTVVFESDERYIRQIQITEKRGDSTLLTFVDALLNTPIDGAAWKVKQRVQ